MVFSRDIAKKALSFLKTDEILLFIGARQAGKTTILKQLQAQSKTEGNTTYFLNLEDPEYRKLLDESPKNLFKVIAPVSEKRVFVFIDEIQYLSDPTNFLKYMYDEHRAHVKLIVSGSSAFYIDRTFKDSLVGRKKIFHVQTLSFGEYLGFQGQDDLAAKLMGTLSLQERETISRYYDSYLIYGGYPRVVLAGNDDLRREVLADIAYSYIKKDIYDSGLRHEEVFYGLFKILAERPGVLVNSNELAGTLSVSKTAIDNYLYVMQRSFHIQLIKPFFTNVRKELIKMPKGYFQDLGLRNFFTRNFDPLLKRSDKGELLENATYRALAEHYELDEIHFWRDADQHEVDFVLPGFKRAYEVKVEGRRFSAKDHIAFTTAYPAFALEPIVYSAKQPTEHEAWELETRT